ncbi:MAG: hypothetical protein JSV50_05860 [Desulfobacteraceae bacterium]|nr:MAG: hypothetical protein JSV50_05860 [Desulfobacteraceae bacterium]
MSNGADPTMIDFISDAVKSTDLTARFLAIPDAGALYTWLTEEGYQVTSDECAKMIEARDNYDRVSRVGILSY